ncbi:profilin-4-like [Lytechinus variegatus]|uniref:profilin-4-like n=1 Tax=Lytechinus variegatus TaxID=7654 RepID=UPI001BB0F4CC|nr:profilin-4-like isoform X2 [Lytechinus variegatus]XP_041461988.1 profilin-4-like [Lytechinus variegatus]
MVDKKSYDQLDKIEELVKLVINHVDPDVPHRPAQDRVKMNQLQSLLHDALIATGHVENCAIIRRKDISLRASSAGFTLTGDEMQKMIDAFKDPPRTRLEGLYFHNRLYKCVRADKNSIYAKCDKDGIVLVKTATLVIMGTYSDNMFPSVCVEAIEKLASYFIEKSK